MSNKDPKQKIINNSLPVGSSNCWEWRRYRLPGGYGRTRWDNENILAHRLSWIAFRGPIPSGKMVCHKCDNPSCCNPDHLFIGSASDNWRDMQNKGRGVRGDHTGSRTNKLTDEQVDFIRSSPESSSALAKQFGCSYTNVYMIRRGLRKTAPRK